MIVKKQMTLNDYRECELEIKDKVSATDYKTVSCAEGMNQQTVSVPVKSFRAVS